MPSFSHFPSRWLGACALVLLLWSPPTHAQSDPGCPQPAQSNQDSPAAQPDPGCPDAGPVAVPAPLDLGPNALRPSGQVVEIKRKVKLTVVSGASATPSHTSKLPVGPHGRKIYVQTVEVHGGRVDVELPSEGRTGALLRAPGGLSAIVTAGRLSMVVKDQSVHVATSQHGALVGIGGRFQSVPPQSVVHFESASGKVSPPAPLPDAPRLRALSTVARTVGGPASVRMHLKGSGNSARIGVFDEKGEQVGKRLLPQAGVFSLPLPGPGLYRVVARALDASGVEGPVGDAEVVRVLGVAGEVPRFNGSYFLAPDENLPLVGARGLEMYHPSTMGFVPAPTTVSLIEEKQTDLVFRDPGDPQSGAVLRLAPRIATARVTLGPGMAIWPRDPITMSIAARDVRGRPLSVDENFEVKVRVNLEEVDVSWSRRDGELQGVLPPREGPGPWVVRVSVIDEYGREVGRNHLEVIRRRRLAYGSSHQ